MKKDDLLDRIQIAEPLAEHHARDILELFGNKAFLAVLKDILLESDGGGAKLLAVDLNSAEGLNVARSIQGMSQGLSRAVDIFMDKAAEAIEPEKESTNDDRE